jgi:hypothetical protein
MQAGTIKTEIWVNQERKPIRLIENLKENLNVIFKLRQ